MRRTDGRKKATGKHGGEGDDAVGNSRAHGGKSGGEQSRSDGGRARGWERSEARRVQGGAPRPETQPPPPVVTGRAGAGGETTARAHSGGGVPLGRPHLRGPADGPAGRHKRGRVPWCSSATPRFCARARPQRAHEGRRHRLTHRLSTGDLVRPPQAPVRAGAVEYVIYQPVMPLFPPRGCSARNYSRRFCNREALATPARDSPFIGDRLPFHGRCGGRLPPLIKPHLFAPCR